MTERGSGKTTRQVERAINTLRSGWSVLFICPTDHEISYTSEIGMIGGELVRTRNKNILEHPKTGGRIIFTSYNNNPDRYEGISKLVVVVDHAARLPDSPYTSHWCDFIRRVQERNVIMERNCE